MCRCALTFSPIFADEVVWFQAINSSKLWEHTGKYDGNENGAYAADHNGWNNSPPGGRDAGFEFPDFVRRANEDGTDGVNSTPHIIRRHALDQHIPDKHAYRVGHAHAE